MKTAYKTPKIKVVELLTPICLYQGSVPPKGTYHPGFDDGDEWPDAE